MPVSRVPPCELALHVASPDVYIHPPPPRARLPGHDKTLSGLVELLCPTERTIHAVRVTLHGLQTLAFPDPAAPDSVRYEEKIIMNKSVEIVDVSRSTPVPASVRRLATHAHPDLPPLHSSHPSEAHSDDLGLLACPGAHHAGEMALAAAAPASRLGAVDVANTASVNVKQEGLHLTPGVHGFEFAFIIPSTSPAYERTKHARLRYVLTATALGAGRGGKGDISVHQDVFVIVQVQPDGGPTPLDLQYQDAHQALGPISISLISASLTVGGIASVQIHHPDPAPGLSVHVIRVFLEQTMELYSSQRKAWLKLPTEKLRLWEKGCMPYRPTSGDVTTEDTVWFAQTTPEGEPIPGRPGCGAGDGRPNMSPFGCALAGTFAHHCPAGPPQLPSGSCSHGYTIKNILRLPDHRVIRPSTVRGSKTDIRITHDIGVEVFFSRLSVLDDRPQSESFGMPKVQVFSMRRAIAIPSCACTHDTIHLPPYSLESPLQSRPPSPAHAMSHLTSMVTRTAPGTPAGAIGAHWPSDLDMRSAAPTAHASPAVSRPASRPGSRSASRAGSRDPSPEREGRILRAGIAAALKSGRRSRHTSPERSDPRRSLRSGLHPFKAAHVDRAPPAPATPVAVPRKLNKSKSSQSLRPPAQGTASGTATPTGSPIKSRPALLTRHSYHTAPRAVLGLLTTNKPELASSTVEPSDSPLPPWSHPPFYTGPTNTSRARCTCGQDSSALADAEQRLLIGVPTAPGAWSESHEHGALPPPWFPADDEERIVFRNTDQSRWEAKAAELSLAAA